MSSYKVPGKQMVIADALSCNPVPSTTTDEELLQAKKSNYM